MGHEKFSDADNGVFTEREKAHETREVPEESMGEFRVAWQKIRSFCYYP